MAKNTAASIRQQLLDLARERETPLPDRKLPIFEISFTSDENKQKQWVAFLRKNGLESDMTFEALMKKLQGFLEPVYTAVASGKQFNSTWLEQQWRG